MSIFVIADLHLSFRVPKPMDIFGDNWTGHEEKIIKNWIEKVKENDLVVLPGDFSWETYLEDTKLDFGYLKELSTIDMYLRYIVMDMCLDIEHVIKVRLIKNITNNPSEDGYDIVRKFIAQDDNLRILKNIRSHKSGEYCKDLIEKYYPYFPVWVFVELISFGDLLYFCSFYEKIYGVQIINNKLMNTVRDVRNAAAHSNCLLNKMTEKIDSTKQVNNEISSFIIGMKNISKTSRVNNLSYKFTNSFVTVLYVYDSLMNEIPKQKRYKEIQEFMNGRVVKNKQFFQSNSKIVGVYNFHKKVIDNLVK